MGQGKCYTSVIANKRLALHLQWVCSAYRTMCSWSTSSHVKIPLGCWCIAVARNGLELVVTVCRSVCAVEVYMKKSEVRWKERGRIRQGSCNVLLVLKTTERKRGREREMSFLLSFFVVARLQKWVGCSCALGGGGKEGCETGSKWMTGNRWHCWYSL